MATLELYLIRHGVAAERGEEYPDDSKRPLTSKGIAALQQGGQGARRARRRVRSDYHQPAARTRQTADVFAEDLKAKPPVVAQRRAGAGGTPAAVIQELGKHMRKARIALVGHEPNIGELAARLIGARSPLEFKKGAICRIDFEVLPPKARGSCGGSCRRGCCKQAR